VDKIENNYFVVICVAFLQNRESRKRPRKKKFRKKGSRVHFEAKDLLGQECADFIRARGNYLDLILRP
jgi:hypothetical protein